jgi:hypothetical protein
MFKKSVVKILNTGKTAPQNDYFFFGVQGNKKICKSGKEILF